MSWYRDWFDSPLYEKMYANRDEEEASRLSEFIARSAPVNHYPYVLDLGCGRGRHSLNLARHGYNVKGIDLSPNAIEKARKKAAEAGLDITFQVGDMREVSEKDMDMVVNLFTTFGYFEQDEENRLVLKNVYDMLRTGGLFFLDYLNMNQAKKDFIPEEKGHIDDISFQIRRKKDQQHFMKEMTFQVPGEREQTFSERVKQYDLKWFEDSFEHIGFTLLQTFGGYSGEEFDENSSPRLLMLCEKTPH